MKPSQMIGGLLRSSQLFDQRQVYEFGRWLDNLQGHTETVTRVVGELGAVAWPHHQHIEQHIDETKYLVVDTAGLGDHTTLQGALNAIASSGLDAETWTVIYRTPTTENISFAPGAAKTLLTVHVWALGGATLTGRVDGDVYGKLHLHNLVISYTSNDALETVTSANGNSLYLYGCTISRSHIAAPENIVIAPAGGTVYLYDCTVLQSVSSPYSVFYGAGTVYAYNCKITAIGAKGIAEANAGASYYFYHSVLSNGSADNLFNTAGGGNVYLARCQFDTTVGGTYTILDGDTPPPDAGSITPAMLAVASAQYKYLVSGATPFAYAESGGALNISSGKTLAATESVTLAAASAGLTATVPESLTMAGRNVDNAFTADNYFVGAGSGVLHGSCYGNEIGWSQASAAQDTWYVISDADMVDGHGGLNLVTHDGSGRLTVTKAGSYDVDIVVSVECSSLGKHVQLGVAVNGTVVDLTPHYEVNTPNAQLTLSIASCVALAANGYVEAAIRTTDTGTPDLSVDHLSIRLTQVGG